MSARGFVRLVGVALVLALSPIAVGYIHFPPMALPKMCQISTHIRVLTVTKYDKEKGVILFEVRETLKGTPSPDPVFRHALRTDAAGVKPILDWLGEGKMVVLCTIEGSGIACGYVFLDDYCYSVDYNREGRFWLMIRAEPAMSACYHGSAGQLQQLVKDILAGKDVKVPVKEPNSPPSREATDKRAREVEVILRKNRNLPPPPPPPPG
jgi:hypothetical protein